MKPALFIRDEHGRAIAGRVREFSRSNRGCPQGGPLRSVIRSSVWIAVSGTTKLRNALRSTVLSGCIGWYTPLDQPNSQP
jgi:hypothetical protein